MGGRLLPALVAVLAGNAVYFALLLRRLPTWLRHRPFTLDAGLALDFLICVAIFIVVHILRGSERSSGGQSN